MPEITQQKCACPDCVCIVAISEAVEKDNKNFCSTECADGHTKGDGCGHKGCGCSG